jgi:uncharacterized protein
VAANSMLDPARAFLGVGWAFPVGVGPDGAIKEAAYDDDIRQAILIILMTSPGERVMRPDFGAGLSDFVFEPVSTALIEQVKDRVQKALVTWEPRIEVMAVDVTTDPAQRNCLLIDMTYQVRATNTRQNLVFPFFLEEGSTQ